MYKISIGILLFVLSTASIARTTFCLDGTTTVAFFNLPQNEREIVCFRDEIVTGVFTEVLLPLPIGPNWSQIDYIRGYSYGNSVYAALCHVINNDTKSCAFNIYQ